MTAGGAMAKIEDVPERGSALDDIREGRPFQSAIHAETLSGDPVLKAEEFSLWYGASRALWDVTMQIPRGKVTALIGPSGCGKSTLPPLCGRPPRDR
ncbi:MAG: ATP-binding cassette domain-containing protein, partial [Planctomycetota bacterium]